MRLFSVRKAQFKDPDLRPVFERHGATVMQAILAAHTTFRYKGQWAGAADPPFVDDLVPWLIEQHDRGEMRDNWLIVMEAAIAFFVILEGINVILGWLHPQVGFRVWRHCRLP